MKLHRLSLVASSDDSTSILESNTYTWSDGDELQHLKMARDKISEYIQQREDSLRTALASQQPLEPS